MEAYRKDGLFIIQKESRDIKEIKSEKEKEIKKKKIQI